jgi:hypothetical protein
MQQLTIEIPDALAQRLAWRAAEEKKSMEQVALEQLASLLEPPPGDLKERYERFFKESGLFVQVSEEEKRKYAAVSAEVREELAHKLGQGKPLSEIIIEERGER